MDPRWNPALCGGALMAREFRLQALGESIAEAEIVAWAVEVGDSVEID